MRRIFFSSSLSCARAPCAKRINLISLQSSVAPSPFSSLGCFSSRWSCLWDFPAGEAPQPGEAPSPSINSSCDRLILPLSHNRFSSHPCTHVNPWASLSLYPHPSFPHLPGNSRSPKGPPRPCIAPAVGWAAKDIPWASQGEGRPAAFPPAPPNPVTNRHKDALGQQQRSSSSDAASAAPTEMGCRPFPAENPE